ncbi:MAG: polysaccharide export protein [Desulfobacula sp.]|mgnify:FL=1|jgi:polysaccharide biosynthesis/export protein|uniref:polysaccharide biosynthesis/export family protein n=1 Tax=Desulfobacula sp. TaxID=2593537 RepID=UPI001D7F8816|nr:polysaccharide export protein [Desulfobacula sp.]MBT3806025.1 polysaccharide export protein [Desulfobacula sp.]MBT4026472.1 polysaccharide export protein [Desulfobacula sp.]MBT4200299.1 polysaccharide export protein [Desulfobacula sp.]MBT4508870.1 polysaccharide export protein [Desulfobacula sp.]
MSIKQQLKYLIIVLFFLACFMNTSNADQDSYSGSSLYKIGIGDILSITTWKEPDFTVESVRVRSDGKITFPLLDDIQAEGLSTMILKKAVQKKLSVYVESPNVTVTLINPMSRRFYILGEILRTGEYPLTKKLTVMQAFALAGGFTEWADKNKILLYRRGDNMEETIIIRYKDIIKGDFSKDIQLQPDDTIIVP